MTNEYGRLIQRVRKVNRKAALMLARIVPLQVSRGQIGNFVSGPDGCKDEIKNIFIWDRTPQGSAYWAAVSRQLGEIR